MAEAATNPVDTDMKESAEVPSKKRTLTDETDQHPSKRQKVDMPEEKKRAIETSTDEPPSKRQKVEIKSKSDLGNKKQRKEQHKKKYIPPPELREKILTTFAKKKPENADIDKFYASVGITNFKDLLQQQQNFFQFCKDHCISWNAEGEVSGPTDEQKKQKLLTQTEFYFSDGNLPRDNFLLKAIQREDNPERWFQLKVLLRFKLVKKWTTDTEYLAAALAPSTTLELNDSKTCVRRKDKLELTRDMLDKRTTAVHNCPTDLTMDQFHEYFSKFGPVLAIFPKRGKKSTPKGVVDVVWKTEEVATQFVELKTVTFMKHDLKIQLLGKKKKEPYKSPTLDFNFVFVVKGLPEEFEGFGELKIWLKAECSLPVHFVCLREDKKSAIIRLLREEGISAEVAVEKMKGKVFKDKEVQAEVVKEENQAKIEKELAIPPRQKGGGRRGGNRNHKKKFHRGKRGRN